MSLYSQSPSDILAPGVTQSITEFVGGFVGACGEAAAAILKGAQNAVTPQATDVTSLANGLISRGLAANNGTTSSQALVSQLGLQGIQASVVDNWRMALTQVGTRPVELLLQNARALPPDAGVFGHFISVVGYSPATGKYIVSDPNAPAARQGKFVLYSLAQLQAAQPVNAIVPKFASGGGNPIQGIGTVAGSVGGVTSGIGNAAGDIAGGVGGLTSQTLADAAQLIGLNFEKAFGVSSAKDLGIRALLIAGAFFLFLFGALALILSRAHANETEVGQVAAVTS